MYGDFPKEKRILVINRKAFKPINNALALYFIEKFHMQNHILRAIIWKVGRTSIVGEWYSWHKFERKQINTIFVNTSISAGKTQILVLFQTNPWQRERLLHPHPFETKAHRIYAFISKSDIHRLPKVYDKSQNRF